MAGETKRSKLTRTVNICVVGLTGIDEERTSYGVGKSCLCNRFVRPAQDDLYNNHSSVYSTSDFSGSVINNDQFLYWGSVSKFVEDNEFVFNVVEQTEFYDDSSYTPLTRGGQLIPYEKRCTATKLHSPGKLMYISRDQVALQNDYDQVRMPEKDGKFHVDGFLCVYDVSENIAEQAAKVQAQENLLSTALTGINKSRKPVIVVATKCDNVDDNLLSQAHKFVHSKKLAVPLIETSAFDNINVDLGFAILAQMVDSKGRFRLKILHFSEGVTAKKEILTKASDKYQSFVRSVVTDLESVISWRQFKNTYKGNDDLGRYIFIAGSSEAERVFSKQVLKIKQHYEEKRLNEYLSVLPDALDELLPTLQTIESYDWKWDLCQQAMKNHKLFEKRFRLLPKDVHWNDREEILCSTDERIPVDVLLLERSRACFDRHVKKLMESAKKVRMKLDFRNLLELTPKIRPGTSWSDAYLWLQNEESYKSLDEHERKEIFEKYLQEITLAAKLEFQELLFEAAPKFMKLDPNGRPSDADMREIYEHLEADRRYKMLENVGNSRDILLFNHIALMQSSNRCLSGPDKCMDRLMQDVVEMTAHRPAYNPYENDLLMDVDDDEQIGIVVLGSNGLALELENKIKLQSSSSDSLEYIVDGQIYALELKVIGDDYSEDPHSFVNSVIDFRPQGYLAIFSDENSLNYLKETLKLIKESDEGSCDAFINLPIILVLASESGREEDADVLRKEGQDLADQLQCLFIDYPYTISVFDGRIHETQVQDSIRGIVDVIRKRSRPPYTPSVLQEKPPDLRILLCAMCGDQYPVELILGPLLHHQSVHCNASAGSDTVILETYVGTVKRSVSITLSSYHRAHSLKNDLYHGFILVYSATRNASFETMSAFAMAIPQAPIQVLAVTGSASGASVVFHNETASTLLAGGTNLANKLSAKFQTTSPLFQHQTGAFAAFFTTAYNKKDETEFHISGIKGRPLPEVPKPYSDAATNGAGLIESDYDVIPARVPLKNADISPYADLPKLVKSRTDTVSEDSAPSSPTRNLSQSSFKEQRSRSSTQGSPDSTSNDTSFTVPHDSTGLYAQVMKDYHKKLDVEKDKSSSGDEDSELQWCDNVAYGSRENDSIILPDSHDRQYNTVPHPSRSQKATGSEKKYATISGATGNKYNEYAVIGNVRPSLFNRESNDPMNRPGLDGYEPGDSLSSLSSKSKDSIGSHGGDDPPFPGVRSRIDQFSGRGQESPKYRYPASPRWRRDGKGQTPEETGPKAPLAKQEDDQEVNDNALEQVRKELKNKLNLHGDPSPIVERKDDAAEAERNNEAARNSDSSESRSRSGSKQDYLTRPFKKIIRKMSPAPSPGNSENDLTKLDSNTLKMRKMSRKKKQKERDSMSNDEKNAVSPIPSEQTPEDKKGDKSNRNSGEVKSKSKFNSLDRIGRKKTESRKHNKNPPSLVVVDTDEVQTKNNSTLSRKDKKKKRQSRDDLELPSETVENPSEDDVTSPKRKNQPKKTRSLRFPREKNKTMKNDKERKMDKARRDWEKKQKNKKVTYEYFGKPLEEICSGNSLLPRFFNKCLEHIELTGMDTEGIYRVSGNKQDIESLLTKFDADTDLSFQELGISVHSITGGLKQFFTLLPDPLVPVEFYKQILDSMVIMNAEERIKKLKEIIQKFPACNLAVFQHLMMHLNKITDHKANNKMDVRNLAICLFPTVMRPDFTNIATISHNMNMGLFLQTCIEQFDGLFDIEMEAT